MNRNINNIAVIGGNGAIGSAFVKQLCKSYPKAKISSFSRSKPLHLLPSVMYYEIDYYDEISIENAAAVASQSAPVDMVIVAVGILHENNISPEKSLKELNFSNFQRFLK